MADRALAREVMQKNSIATQCVARLESPLAKQLRVHPAAADGYRSQRDGWSTRVFVDPSLRESQAAGPER